MLKGFWKRNEGMSFINRLKDLKRELKYAWQRAWRGYDDCDVWGFGDAIIEKIVLILNDFIKLGHSYPSELTSEEWESILKEMLIYFQNADENYVDDNYNFDNILDQYNFMQGNLEEGMKLFTKYCYSLWD